MGYTGCHVHRNRPQPELAPRHPPARGLARNGKVRKRTLANLVAQGKNRHPRRLLKDEPLVGRDDAFDIVRSLPHGHAAVLGTAHTAPGGSSAHSPQRERVHGRWRMTPARSWRPGVGRGDRARFARRDTGSRAGRLYASMDWLLEPGPHRAGLGETPSRGRHPGALRPHVGMDGGTDLPAGQARSFARRQAGQAANRVRVVVRA